MSNLHHAYLNLGSNIEPEINLPAAVRLLREQGEVAEVSTVWESHAFGSNGPNFLNACVLFICPFEAHELKEKIIRPIEAARGRVRSADKFAPRPMDIDIILFDGEPYSGDFWSNAFVVVPLADLLPDLPHPLHYEKLARVAGHMRKQTWIAARPEVNLK